METATTFGASIAAEEKVAMGVGPHGTCMFGCIDWYHRVSSKQHIARKANGAPLHIADLKTEERCECDYLERYHNFLKEHGHSMRQLWEPVITVHREKFVQYAH